jgi:hypothetical protein
MDLKWTKAILLKNLPHLYQYSFSLKYGYTLLGFHHEVSEVSAPNLRYSLPEFSS